MSGEPIDIPDELDTILTAPRYILAGKAIRPYNRPDLYLETTDTGAQVGVEPARVAIRQKRNNSAGGAAIEVGQPTGNPDRIVITAPQGIFFEDVAQFSNLSGLKWPSYPYVLLANPSTFATNFTAGQYICFTDNASGARNYESNSAYLVMDWSNGKVNIMQSGWYEIAGGVSMQASDLAGNCQTNLVYRYNGNDSSLQISFQRVTLGYGAQASFNTIAFCAAGATVGMKVVTGTAGGDTAVLSVKKMIN